METSTTKEEAIKMFEDLIKSGDANIITQYKLKHEGKVLDDESDPFGEDHIWNMAYDLVREQTNIQF